MKDFGSLCLTRRVGEYLTIGDEDTDNYAEVHVSSINGNQVRLMVRCDKRIPIHRSEVYAKIKAEQKS